MIKDDFPTELTRGFWTAATRGARIGLPPAMFKLFDEAEADYRELRPSGVVPAKFDTWGQMVKWKAAGGAGEKITKVLTRVLSLQKKINEMPKYHGNNKDIIALRAILMGRSTEYTARIISAKEHCDKILKDGELKTRGNSKIFDGKINSFIKIKDNINHMFLYGSHEALKEFSLNLFNYISAVNYFHMASGNFCDDCIRSVFPANSKQTWLAFSSLCKASSSEHIGRILKYKIAKGGSAYKGSTVESIKYLGSSYLSANKTIDVFVEKISYLDMTLKASL